MEVKTLQKDTLVYSGREDVEDVNRERVALAMNKRVR